MPCCEDVELTRSWGHVPVNDCYARCVYHPEKHVFYPKHVVVSNTERHNKSTDFLRAIVNNNQKTKHFTELPFCFSSFKPKATLVHRNCHYKALSNRRVTNRISGKPEDRPQRIQVELTTDKLFDGKRVMPT